MPRFYFHVYDGKTVLDPDGLDLPDLNFARREAVRYSGALLEEAARRNELGRDWRMEVTNADGLILFTLHFFVSDAPAISESAGRSKLLDGQDRSGQS